MPEIDQGMVKNIVELTKIVRLTGVDSLTNKPGSHYC